MMEWQLIETAPTDGTVVMLFDPVLFWPTPGEHVTIDEGFGWRSINYGWIDPTHWMPLPEPPK
jgi:hypothetical protein